MEERIRSLHREATINDKSFQDGGLSIFFGRKYSQKEMRETWLLGIKHGIGIGLFNASLEGQKIELNNNIKNEKQKEFVEKFYKLAEEYGMAIQYHPLCGMVIIDRNY